MFKQIMVAVDGSSTSGLAVKAAVGLAKEHGARLRIVHVVDEATFNLEGEVAQLGEIQQTLGAAGHAILDKAQALARESGVDAETSLLEIQAAGYRVAEAIAEAADSWPADLIVIGSHGRRGLSRRLLGSVAEGVVRTATRPVLLIRGEGAS